MNLVDIGSQLSIRTKLIVAFVSVLGLHVLTGFIALDSLGAVNAQAELVRDHWLPSVSTIGQLIDAVERYRIWETRVFVAQTADDRNKAIAQLEVAKGKVSDIRARYQPMTVAGRADIKLIEQFDQAWNAHTDVIQKLVDDLKDAGDAPYAGSLALGKSQQEENDVYNAIDYLYRDLEFSTYEGKRAADRGASTYRDTQRLINVAMFSAVALSGMLGIYLSRILARPVADLTEAMRQMADEKFDVEVPEQNRGDEVGVMARALNDFKNGLIDRRRLIEEEKKTLVTLHQAQKELLEAEKHASLGRLVAGVAHEINTPLGSAYVLATTLVEGHTDFERKVKENQIRKSDLEAFVSLVGRASGLIEVTLRKASDLVRNFKQVAVDQTSDKRRTFMINELIQQVSSTVVPLFKGTSHEIEIVPSEDVEMDSFPGPLGQVVNNLVSNALIHGYDGIESGVVRIDTQRLGASQVVLRVSDNGRGIKPEHLAHVFEPFFTTRLGQGGSGLGLNIVQGIVTRVLGGTIDVKSEPGKGTTFLVTLPVKAPEG